MGSGSNKSKKKPEKFEKKILTLFERAGPKIGKEVEMSWKKWLKKVKIHKKAIIWIMTLVCLVSLS